MLSSGGYMTRNKVVGIIAFALILSDLMAFSNTALDSSTLLAQMNGRMSDEVQISTTTTPFDGDRHLPAVAYSTIHNQFLVVWHNNWGDSRDIYGQRVDASGKKIGSWFYISSGPGDRIQPAVAYSPTSDLYFVVYMHDVSAAHDGSRYDIEGQLVRWDGVLIGTPFTIESSPVSSFWSPKIAKNGVFDDFGVVWGVVDIASGMASAIGLKAYTAAGVYLYGTILDSNGNPNNPDLAWNPVNKQFLVVWNRFNPTLKNVVIGDLRNQDYNRVLPGIIIIYDNPNNHALFPRVTYGGGYYGVIFEYEASSTDHDIYMALVYHDASTIISPIPVETSVANETHPAIAGNPNAQTQEYMILFQRAGVNGATVWMRPISNYMASVNHEVCNYAFWDCTFPAITKGGAGYLMAYTMDSVGDPTVKQHVFGRMFWQFSAFLPMIEK